jgi:hypothetical protein
MVPSTSPLTLPERLPEPGEMVLVRSRRWLVEDVNTPNGERSTIVRLACADDDAQGQEREVFSLRAGPADRRGRGLGRPGEPRL